MAPWEHPTPRNLADEPLKGTKVIPTMILPAATLQGRTQYELSKQYAKGQVHSTMLDAQAMVAAMTTYSISGHFGGGNTELWQWNFINSSSETLQISLSSNNIGILTGGSGYWQYGVSTTLYDAILSSSQLLDPSSIPSTVTNTRGYYYSDPLSSPIELPPGSTLVLYGQATNEFGNEEYAISGTNTPTILVNGEYALFSYNNSFDYSKQYVNVEGANGFTVTENTSTQNNVSGNGVEIQNGGGGGPLETGNMCFQIGDIGATITGTEKSERINGNNLNNIITSYAGQDVIFGLAGADYIVSGKGVDKIYGGEDSDILIAGSGHDLLEGGAGDDFLNGGKGRDKLTGGLGADILIGGIGGDIFCFNFRPITLTTSTADRITDFSSNQKDKIQIDRTAFGIPLTAKVSFTQTSSTQSLSQALATSSLLVLDADTGDLWFNQNGSASDSGNGGIFAILDKTNDVVPMIGARNFAFA